LFKASFGWRKAQAAVGEELATKTVCTKSPIAQKKTTQS
jgi:hypothetical protein